MGIDSDECNSMETNLFSFMCPKSLSLRCLNETRIRKSLNELRNVCKPVFHYQRYCYLAFQGQDVMLDGAPLPIHLTVTNISPIQRIFGLPNQGANLSLMAI